MYKFVQTNFLWLIQLEQLAGRFFAANFIFKFKKFFFFVKHRTRCNLQVKLPQSLIIFKLHAWCEFFITSVHNRVINYSPLDKEES